MKYKEILEKKALVMQIYLTILKRVSLQSQAAKNNYDELTPILQEIETAMHEDLFAFYFLCHTNLST